MVLPVEGTVSPRRAFALVWLFLAFGFLTAPLSTASAQEKAPAPRPADKAFADRIDVAIDKGLAALLKMPVDDKGSFPGYEAEGYGVGATSLAILVMSECGVSRAHPLMTKCWERVHKEYRSIHDRGGDLHYTYALAVNMLALESFHTPKPKKGEQHKPPAKVALPPKDFAWMQEMARWLVAHRAGKGWSYTPPQPEDLSNTQYALLALRSADRCGAAFDRGPLFEVFEWILSFQYRSEGLLPRATVDLLASGPRVTMTPQDSGDEARGWGYSPDPQNAPCASMTCGGITSLVILRDLLMSDKKFTGEMAKRADMAVFEGFAWLDKNWSVTENRGRGSEWLYYYLYSMERVGSLTKREFIGKHQWYIEGAERLLALQKQDGTWENPKPGHTGIGGQPSVKFLDTCFALLFLKRMTVPARIELRPPEITYGPGARPKPPTPPPATGAPAAGPPAPVPAPEAPGK
ncbi:MAG: hypothetical protein HY719_04395 [Planctomycetes bacterium]|nr:hypothetical protein [Planctomycetota bacterium]